MPLIISLDLKLKNKNLLLWTHRIRPKSKKDNLRTTTTIAVTKPLNRTVHLRIDFWHLKRRFQSPCHVELLSALAFDLYDQSLCRPYNFVVSSMTGHSDNRNMWLNEQLSYAIVLTLNMCCTRKDMCCFSWFNHSYRFRRDFCSYLYVKYRLVMSESTFLLYVSLALPFAVFRLECELDFRYDCTLWCGSQVFAPFPVRFQCNLKLI